MRSKIDEALSLADNCAKRLSIPTIHCEALQTLAKEVRRLRTAAERAGRKG